MWRGYGGGASRRVGRPGVGWGWMEGGVWDVGEVGEEIYGREGRGGGGARASLHMCICMVMPGDGGYVYICVTFSGLTSRCATPRPCMCSSAAASCEVIAAAKGSGSPPPSCMCGLALICIYRCSEPPAREARAGGGALVCRAASQMARSTRHGASAGWLEGSRSRTTRVRTTRGVPVWGGAWEPSFPNPRGLFFCAIMRARRYNTRGRGI